MSTIDQAKIRESPPAKDRCLNYWCSRGCKRGKKSRLQWQLREDRPLSTMKRHKSCVLPRRQFISHFDLQTGCTPSENRVTMVLASATIQRWQLRKPILFSYAGWRDRVAGRAVTMRSRRQRKQDVNALIATLASRTSDSIWRTEIDISLRR